MSRLRDLEGEFDVLVIGGGIIGAGIARDAALRGLRVALIERADYGGGTTAGSTRLIHGGLRYLEMLDFRLVRLDLRERELLLRNAAHLVKPLEFLIPLYDRSLFYRTKLHAGMTLYDLLSFDKSLPNHRRLDTSAVEAAEPELRRDGLQGGFCYYDAQVSSPERLTIENIVDACEHGAVTLNYAEATAAIESGGAIRGARVRDVLEGGETEVRARLVVNAAGPWFDRVAARLAPHPRKLIRTTKGVHLACAPVSRKANVLFSGVDGRLFFVIPWLGFSWIGTTDTEYDGDPAQAHATREDIDYLIRSAGAFYPELRSGAIYWTNAGVRALVSKRGSESSVSRLHRITAERPGLISVLGGKITGYRAIAEGGTDKICRKLGLKRKCVTAEAPLPGARDRFDVSDPLAGVYGCRSSEVRRLADADPRLSETLANECTDIAAQVVYSVRREQCVRVSDFLLRRSLLGFGRDQGLAAASAVARHMAAELGWSASRQEEELKLYCAAGTLSRNRRR